MDKIRTSFYFSCAAAAAAAVTAPSLAEAFCGCTASTMGGGVNKVFGPEIFKQASFSGKAGYLAEMPHDGMYYFASSDAPTLWFDYTPVSSANTTINYQFCRTSWTGTAASCGATGWKTTFSATAQEASDISEAGVYAVTNSVWDRYTLAVFNNASSATPWFTPMTIPANIRVGD